MIIDVRAPKDANLRRLCDYAFADCRATRVIYYGRSNDVMKLQFDVPKEYIERLHKMFLAYAADFGVEIEVVASTSTEDTLEKGENTMNKKLAARTSTEEFKLGVRQHKAALDFLTDIENKMHEQGLDPAEISRRLGKYPTWFTRVLEDKAYLTLFDMVGLTDALGMHVEFRAVSRPNHTTFKPGDWLRCIDDDHANRGIVNGNLYRVVEISGSTIQFEGGIFGFSTRFELVSDAERPR